MTSVIAIVRPPTDALVHCELTHLDRTPIDPERARAQHTAYCALLEELGARLVVLPPDPTLPDGVFVEDTAVVLDELAVVTVPGAASRGPEVDDVAAALAAFRPVARMKPPATLDGGDVLHIDRTLYVGRSSRTNDAGIDQLAALVAPHGYTVRPVRVQGCLHLKSACSYLGGRAVLANPGWVDVRRFEDFHVLPVADAEPRAGNSFRVGGTVVMAAGFPLTEARIRERGLALRTVDLSELQKAEAGGSCMSVIVRVAA